MPHAARDPSCTDDGVAGYQYDRVFVNDGALDALPDKVRAFFADWLKNTQ